MVYIYILQLEQGKYYVGKTMNPSFRLDSHFNSNGSSWTKLYKPIKMVELIPDCDDYDEDKYTRMFMDKYGVENVRGGSFVSIELEQSTINHLTQMKNGTNDNCFNCGKSGHFAKYCKNKKEVTKEVTKEVAKEKDKPCTCPTSYFSRHRRSQCLLLNTLTPINPINLESNKNNETKEESNTVVCFRCGREGHYANACYASKHIRGYYL
jgi:hypothetical protein